jgi:hypothetical protein
VWLNQDDPAYFVEFVLLDEACRVPAGKRQTKAMSGFWLSRPGKVGRRLSDRRLRWGACIEALRRIGGMPVDKAAAYVADALGEPFLWEALP